MKRFTATIVSLFLILPLVSHAAIFEAGPSDDIKAMISALQPGDELVLAGGTYELSSRFGFSINGTETDPIVIRAADGETPHIHRPLQNQNIWDFSGSYFTIRGIEFSGGSAGLRFEGGNNITIENCEIHDTAQVALRMNDSSVTYENIKILNNHIHHTGGTGEGMYLGCNNGACMVLNSTFSGNYIHNTDGPTVTQGDGIELKEGSAGNVISDNVIHDARFPCILTYSAAGNGSANIIERNVMWGCGDHAIQSAQDSIIRNNIILGTRYDAISLQPHQNGVPGNQMVVHNTIFNEGGNGIVVRNATGDVVVANNAVYVSGGSALKLVGSGATVTFAGNVGVGGVDAVSSGYTEGDISADMISAHTDNAPPIDCFPKTDGALVGTASSDYLVTDDFNGTPRGGSLDVGAYLYNASGNPGWTITTDFKDEVTVPEISCGDGVIEGTEECDDGNTEDNDGCSSACAQEEGFNCTGEPSECVSSTEVECGNGLIEAGEACDDGNGDDGDGCDAQCNVEAGFSCTGQPSTCVEAQGECGDGAVNFGEECDDGNLDDDDGCSSSCTVEEMSGDDSADSGCACSTPGRDHSSLPISIPFLLFGLFVALRLRTH